MRSENIAVTLLSSLTYFWAFLQLFFLSSWISAPPPFPSAGKESTAFHACPSHVFTLGVSPNAGIGIALGDKLRELRNSVMPLSTWSHATWTCFISDQSEVYEWKLFGDKSLRWRLICSPLTSFPDPLIEDFLWGELTPVGVTHFIDSSTHCAQCAAAFMLSNRNNRRCAWPQMILLRRTIC